MNIKKVSIRLALQTGGAMRKFLIQNYLMSLRKEIVLDRSVRN